MNEPVPIGSLLERWAEQARRLAVPLGPAPDPWRREPAPTLDERWLALCPERFWEATLDGIDQAAEVKADLVAWATDPAERRNLVLLGPKGRGKTFAAMACAREWHRRGRSVEFAPVAAMLDDLRPGGPAEPRRYCAPALLVLDDLGGDEKVTPWSVERLHIIVNDRWLHRRSTVVTSNLEPELIAERIGERTWDRLRDSALALRIGGGPSRRRSA